MKKLLAPLLFCSLFAACHSSRNIPEHFQAHKCTIQVTNDTIRALLNEKFEMNSNDTTRVTWYNSDKQRLDTFPQSTYLACSLSPQKLPTCSSVDSLILKNEGLLKENLIIPLVKTCGSMEADILLPPTDADGLLLTEKGQGKEFKHTNFVNYSTAHNNHPIQNGIDSILYDLTTSTIDTRQEGYMFTVAMEKSEQSFPDALIVSPNNPKDPCSVYRAHTSTEQNKFEYFTTQKNELIDEIRKAQRNLNEFPQIFVEKLGCPLAMASQFESRGDFLNLQINNVTTTLGEVQYTKQVYENPCDEEKGKNCIQLNKAGSTIQINSDCENQNFTYYVSNIGGGLLCSGSTSTSIDLNSCNLPTNQTIYIINVFNQEGNSTTLKILYP